MVLLIKITEKVIVTVVLFLVLILYIFFPWKDDLKRSNGEMIKLIESLKGLIGRND